MDQRRVSRRTLTKAAAAVPFASGALVAAAATSLHSVVAQDAAVLLFGTNAADVAELNPHKASSTAERTIVDMVFSGLVRFTPGNSGSFEPDIATELPTAETAADGSQVWTFTLRDDVMAHATGSSEAYALTSADVLFSFEHAANADTSSNAGNYAGWAFAAPDPQTFTVTLAAPLSETLFLPNVANYAGGYIIPEQSYTALGVDAFKLAPAGTGPFVFSAYTPQSGVTLTANADFYRGAPKLGGVEVQFLPDIAAREAALKSGDLHVISGLPESTWVDGLNGEDGFQADVFGVGESVFLNLNINHEILSSAQVREAILLAVNRDDYVGLAGAPVAAPEFSFIPSDFVTGGLDQAKADAAEVNFAQDTERAKALLAEAGHPDGFELDLVTSEQEAYTNAYLVLQEQLSEIGVTINLETVQHQAMHDLIRQDANAITVYIAFRPTADVYLTQFFTTSGGTTNFSKFTVDDLVTQARTETDAAAQAALWEEANVAIIKDFAGYGLMYVNQVYAKAASVDYGHELTSVVQLYPGIDETTSIAAE